MMRLADRQGLPLSRVLAEYPSWELPYWQVWMAHEPTDGQRTEYMLAQIASMYAGSHRKKGARAPQPKDFMLPDYWSTQNAKADTNKLINMFADAGCTVKTAKPADENRNLDNS